MQRFRGVALTLPLPAGPGAAAPQAPPADVRECRSRRVAGHRQRQKGNGCLGPLQTVTVGLVVDHSGSMGSKLSDVIAAARTFVQASNPEGRMSIVNFNEKVTMACPIP